MTLGARRWLPILAVAVIIGGCGDLSPTPAPPDGAATATSAAGTPVAGATAGPGTPDPQGSEGSPPDAATIASAITEGTFRARLDALAAVSDAPAGYRAVGTDGFDAAADLVESALQDAGWRVSRFRFTMPGFVDPGQSSLVVADQTFTPRDILPLIYAPPGDVSGPIVAIDWAGGALGPTGKGCVVGDYGVLPAGAVVVVRSGPCYRRDEVLAAQAAGAGGFVAAYPQAGPGAALRPTLLDPDGLEIPAVGASRRVAEAMVTAADAGGTAHLTTDALTEDVPTHSVIAELPGRDPSRVVMVGAHLDSVVDGPGINDNGSGVAALLELASALRGTTPGATIRLAFWTGEELGLRGSTEYVRSLSAEERGRIVAYLNADMVASPQGFAGVYDQRDAAAGSSAIRDLLEAAVERLGGTAEPVDVGGSDHQPFTAAGIATGGVYSGANEPMTASQAAASGAAAGQPADACYHQPCDGASNVDAALGRMLTVALGEAAIGLSEGAAPSP